MAGNLLGAQGMAPAQEQKAQQGTLLAGDRFLSARFVPSVAGCAPHDRETHVPPCRGMAGLAEQATDASAYHNALADDA